MINHKQFRQYVIQPSMERMRLGSPAFEELAVLTMAAESRGGHYLHQLGSGPAVGPYQMEPATHDDIWYNFLRYRGMDSHYRQIEDYLAQLGQDEPETLAERARSLQVPGLCDESNAVEMHFNWAYATAMCRLHYLRVPEPLPAAHDVAGLARYWKQHYNTHTGAGDVQKAIQAYYRFMRQP